VKEPAYTAIIYREHGSVAGTGFSIREGFLTSCAHVVRDALGLGTPTNKNPAQGRQQRHPASTVSASP
jgi:hypothetical protein